MQARLSSTETNSTNNHASWEQNYRSLMVDKNEVDRQLAHQIHQLQAVVQVSNLCHIGAALALHQHCF
jgi:hypothetical protein